MSDRKEPRISLSDTDVSAARQPEKTAEEKQQELLQRAKAARQARLQAEARARAAAALHQEAQPASTAASELPPALVADATASGGGKSGLPILVLFLLLLTGWGLAGWQYWQLQQWRQDWQMRFATQDERLQQLGGLLAEAGADWSEAGSSMSEKLVWAEEEIHKLWRLANNRNRPAIAELQQKMTQAEARLAQLDQHATRANRQVQELAQQLQGMQQQQQDALQQMDAVAQRITENALSLSVLNEQLRTQDMRAQVAELQQRLSGNSSSVNLAALQQQLIQQQEVLTSLEASRQQLTSRLTSLMDEVRQLQQATP